MYIDVFGQVVRIPDEGAAAGDLNRDRGTGSGCSERVGNNAMSGCRGIECLDMGRLEGPQGRQLKFRSPSQSAVPGRDSDGGVGLSQEDSEVRWILFRINADSTVQLSDRL